MRRLLAPAILLLVLGSGTPAVEHSTTNGPLFTTEEVALVQRAARAGLVAWDPAVAITMVEPLRLPDPGMYVDRRPKLLRDGAHVPVRPDVVVFPPAEWLRLEVAETFNGRVPFALVEVDGSAWQLHYSPRRVGALWSLSMGMDECHDERGLYELAAERAIAAKQALVVEFGQLKRPGGPGRGPDTWFDMPIRDRFLAAAAKCPSFAVLPVGRHLRWHLLITARKHPYPAPRYDALMAELAKRATGGPAQPLFGFMLADPATGTFAMAHYDPLLAEADWKVLAAPGPKRARKVPDELHLLTVCRAFEDTLGCNSAQALEYVAPARRAALRARFEADGPMAPAPPLPPPRPDTLSGPVQDRFERTQWFDELVAVRGKDAIAYTYGRLDEQTILTLRKSGSSWFVVEREVIPMPAP